MENKNSKKQLICFCFGYSAEDIEKDVIKNGQSLIMARITAEKKAGGCNCTTRNPKGSGCLADVRQVVNKAQRIGGQACGIPDDELWH